MFLADLGAEVVRVDRPPGGSGFFAGSEHVDIMNRGKQSLLLDLKKPEAVDVLLRMVEHADVLIEGYRPGVAEKLGGRSRSLPGPQPPKLVYGRITGWGQDGPLAQSAGHDIDYIALTGALHAIGPPADGAPPQIPLNLLGDFGGGGAYLVIGVLAALIDAKATGTGQVVDAAIVDGVSHLLSSTHMMIAAGAWADRRQSNMLDGGTPYYSIYETADGRHMAVGASSPSSMPNFSPASGWTSRRTGSTTRAAGRGFAEVSLLRSKPARNQSGRITSRTLTLRGTHRDSDGRCRKFSRSRPRFPRRGRRRAAVRTGAAILQGAVDGELAASHAR